MQPAAKCTGLLGSKFTSPEISRVDRPKGFLLLRTASLNEAAESHEERGSGEGR